MIDLGEESCRTNSKKKKRTCWRFYNFYLIWNRSKARNVSVYLFCSFGWSATKSEEEALFSLDTNRYCCSRGLMSALFFWIIEDSAVERKVGKTALSSIFPFSFPCKLLAAVKEGKRKTLCSCSLMALRLAGSWVMRRRWTCLRGDANIFCFTSLWLSAVSGQDEPLFFFVLWRSDTQQSSKRQKTQYERKWKHFFFLLVSYTFRCVCEIQTTENQCNKNSVKSTSEKKKRKRKATEKAKDDGRFFFLRNPSAT